MPLPPDALHEVRALRPVRPAPRVALPAALPVAREALLRPHAPQVGLSGWYLHAPDGDLEGVGQALEQAAPRPLAALAQPPRLLRVADLLPVYNNMSLWRAADHGRAPAFRDDVRAAGGA